MLKSSKIRNYPDKTDYYVLTKLERYRVCAKCGFAEQACKTHPSTMSPYCKDCQRGMSHKDRLNTPLQVFHTARSIKENRCKPEDEPSFRHCRGCRFRIINDIKILCLKKIKKELIK